MSELQTAKVNESMPAATVAVESNDTLPTTGVKAYTVPILADIQAELTGYVSVYASSVEEAIEKVQDQIDAETLDDSLNMEDEYSGYRMSYREMSDCFMIVPEINASSVEADENEDVDPFDVLEADITQLEATINWDVGKQAKLKAFLTTLTEAHVAAA